jgi:hypothetical protein
LGKRKIFERARLSFFVERLWFPPFCQRSQFDQNLLQTLEPTLMIRCCGGTLFASV